MAVDFSQDIKTTERQMNTYIRKGQKVPKDVLSHYTNLLSGTLNAQQVENGQSDDFPSGDLSTTFTDATTTDSVILIADTDREYILIQNTGDEIIYLNFNAPAAVDGGLKLGPDASWSTQIPQFAKAEIHTIAEANTSALAIYTIG